MSGRLDGKVAVVTGAANGIGRAYARRLAADGASVAILDVADAHAVVDEIRVAGGTAFAARVDLTDAPAVSDAAAAVRAALGVVDILVNNAGIYPNQPLEGMTLQEWRRIFAVNVDATFIVTQAFVPGMKDRGWVRIVNMTSDSIGLVLPGVAHYIATKMAIIGFTRGLATELAAFGVTANAIAPSVVRTPGTEAFPESAFDMVAQMQAIKRVQTPEDLTGTLAYLVSDDAAFITGQTIYVDGGLIRGA